MDALSSSLDDAVKTRTAAASVVTDFPLHLYYPQKHAYVKNKFYMNVPNGEQYNANYKPKWELGSKMAPFIPREQNHPWKSETVACLCRVLALRWRVGFLLYYLFHFELDLAFDLFQIFAPCVEQQTNALCSRNSVIHSHLWRSTGPAVHCF